MSEREFRAELRYRMSLSVARSMLEEGAITEEEYREIDTILVTVQHPVKGTLIFGQNRENKISVSSLL